MSETGQTLNIDYI